MTGDNVVLSLATVLSGILMTIVGLFGIRKRKED
ncbi:LPXTG cell wall anchor domain-containing protein [Streptococcus gallolyticus]